MDIRNSRIPWIAYPSMHVGRLIGHDPIWCLFITPDQQILVAGGERVSLATHTDWHALPLPEVVENPRFGSMAWFQDQLWVCSTQLYHYDRSTWQRIDHTQMGYVSRMMVDHEEVLWVQTVAAGVWYTTDGAIWEELIIPKRKDRICAMWMDAKGGIWIATDDQVGVRIHHRSQGIWQGAIDLPKQKNVAFTVFVTDNSGSVWMGTENHGVWKWDGQYVIKYTCKRDTGLMHNRIVDIVVDQRNRVWAATLGGLSMFHRSEWNSICLVPIEPTNPPNFEMWAPHNHHPTTLSYDSNGRLWIGMSNGELGWMVAQTENAND